MASMLAQHSQSTQLSQQHDKCAEIWEKQTKAKTPGAHKIAMHLQDWIVESGTGLTKDDVIEEQTLEASKAHVTKKLAEPVIAPKDMNKLTFKCCNEINNAKKYVSMVKNENLWDHAVRDLSDGDAASQRGLKVLRSEWFQ